jgi:hypothetical protein
MQKKHSKNAEAGVCGRQSLKSRSDGNHKNGFMHVASPATASEIQRTLGIKRSHIDNMMRAFAAAGVKI